MEFVEICSPYCYKLSELVEWLYTYANRTKETGAHFRRSNITAKKIFITNFWETWAWIRKYQVEWNWEWVEQTVSFFLSFKAKNCKTVSRKI